MPGPGGKKNGAKKHPKTNTANELSVSKSSEARSLVSESYVEEIGNAEGWNRTVDILCDYFNIPDLFIEISKLTPALVGLLEEHSDDENIAELIITIFSHSVVPVLVKLSDTQQDNQSDVALLKTLDMARVIKEVTLQIKKPFASKFLIEHGARMLSLSAETCSEAMFANPSSVHFLVAGLRSTEWENRTTCLNGVLRLFRMKAETDTRNLDLRTFFQHARQRLPDHLMDILGDYGLLRSETIIMKTTESQFQRAIMSVLQDRDLHKLGLILADLIVQTEFSIPDGAFEEEDPRTGKRKKATFDTGLPFKTFREALPQCARVFRQRAAPGELDKADILDIKYLIMQANIHAAAEVGSKGLLRNPNMAYFQYAQSLLADPAVVLRSAKKGLKCKQTSPFIRFQLLQRAVENAGQLGLQTLEQASSAEDPKWEEGVAFFMSAWTDSNTFLAEAPPDNRHMRNILYWNILLAIIIRGPELNPNLEEIKSSLKKLSESDDFTRAFSQPIPNTQLRLAQAAIVKQYSAAVSEWEEVILRLNNSSEKQPEVLPDSEKVQNDLNNFLNDLQLDDESPAKRVAAHPKVNLNSVLLYQCSWCLNFDTTDRDDNKAEMRMIGAAGVEGGIFGNSTTTTSTAGAVSTTSSASNANSTDTGDASDCGDDDEPDITSNSMTATSMDCGDETTIFPTASVTVVTAVASASSPALGTGEVVTATAPILSSAGSVTTTVTSSSNATTSASNSDSTTTVIDIPAGTDGAFPTASVSAAIASIASALSASAASASAATASGSATASPSVAQNLFTLNPSSVSVSSTIVPTSSSVPVRRAIRGRQILSTASADLTTSVSTSSFSDVAVATSSPSSTGINTDSVIGTAAIASISSGTIAASAIGSPGVASSSSASSIAAAITSSTTITSSSSSTTDTLATPGATVTVTTTMFLIVPGQTGTATAMLSIPTTASGSSAATTSASVLSDSAISIASSTASSSVPLATDAASSSSSAVPSSLVASTDVSSATDSAITSFTVLSAPSATAASSSTSAGFQFTGSGFGRRSWTRATGAI
ncbi:hypothetical protein HHX47_DHR4000901 [Lentinula edodes]|nr:hypothetical protein HHX47_DHR4000901 [Lentinula edodes]